MANPNGKAGFLHDNIEVRVNGIATKNPTMFVFGLENKTGRKLQPDDFGGPISIRSQSVFRHGHIAMYGTLEEPTQSLVSLTDHELLIDPLELDRGGTLNFSVILDGSGEDLNISSPLIPVVVSLPLVPDQDSPMTVSLERPVRKRAQRFRGLSLRR
jgi:hypothetical protein